MEENKLIKEYQERKEIRKHHHSKEPKICPNCKKFRIPFFKGSDWCQNCYRKYLETYCYYDYKDKKPKINSNEYKICELIVNKNLKPKEIVEKYGSKIGISSVNYIRNIISKYLEKCDSLGNKKPNILNHK